MKSKYEQDIRFFFNSDNNRLYRIVNSKYISVWLCSKREWSRCATSVDEVYEGHRNNKYIVVNETSLQYYKQRGLQK